MKVNVQGQRDSLTVNSIFNPALSLALALFEIESGSQHNLRPDTRIGQAFQKQFSHNFRPAPSLSPALEETYSIDGAWIK